MMILNFFCKSRNLCFVPEVVKQNSSQNGAISTGLKFCFYLKHHR